MKRLNLPVIAAASTGAFALLALLAVNLFGAPGGAFDSYGGNRAFPDTATGFFHLKKMDGRHFLVTPEGNGYRALGINHFHMMTSKDFDGAVRKIKEWGFNAGCYQGPRWMWQRHPYTKGINLVPTSPYKSDSHFGFRDVFDAEYLTTLEASIRKIVEPQSENPFLIGYFWTDIGVWERERKGESWIGFFKSLPEGSSGGKVWSEWKAKYPEADENDFLPVIAKQLYSKAHGFFRKYDKNHLIFGDRWHEIDMPDKVVRESLPYIDAIAIQPTSREFNHKFFERVYKAWDKPIYIADHVSSFATEKYPKTMGQAAKSAEDYTNYYHRYVTTALSQPYLIGYNKCQYQDQLSPTGMLKQGLVRMDETPWPTIEGIQAANRKALALVYSGNTEEAGEE